MLVVILVFWQTFERISAQGKQPTGSHEANFQWWVRNTFNLKVLPGGTTCIVRKEGNRNAGKYIAIKEHLYDMIASAHEQTCHGRRDAMKFKVCANVKLLWTSQHPNRITLLVQGLLYCPSRFVKDVIDIVALVHVPNQRSRSRLRHELSMWNLSSQSFRYMLGALQTLMHLWAGRVW